MNDKPARPSGRYLKYAIGEIFLVVVGILIALGLNNWRENGLVTKLELKLLAEIQTTLDLDRARLSKAIIRVDQTRLAATLLRTHMKNDLPMNDSLNAYFSSISFVRKVIPELASYQSLINAGLNTVKNDELRLLIPDYFQIVIRLSDIDDNFDLGRYFRENIYPKYFKSFSWGEQGSVPRDYAQLKKTDEFYIALDYTINDTQFYSRSFQRILELNQQLRALLSVELKNRKR